MTPLETDDGTAILDRYTAVMERIADGAELTTVLDSVAIALEELIPRSLCSILLIDRDGTLRHGSAPSLPLAYSREIDGLVPGALAGSCGTAAYTGRSIVAEDVHRDPRWVAFRPLATEHGLGACWSTPIRVNDTIVGTFAVYHRHPWAPVERHRELVGRFSHLASLAIAHGTLQAERDALREADLARRATESANRARSSFVTALSHELRTPLQAITGFTELLKTTDLTPERRREALDRIETATSHILSLVDDVLDLARVEAGALPFDVKPVDVDEVIPEVAELLRPLAERKQMTILTRLDGSVVDADRRRLTQVLINLLANAIRFSRHETTVVVESSTTGGVCRLCVADNGPGIPAELMARLFVPFDRLDAEAGTEGGAGLGLVLARRLTEAIGGTLDIDSVVGVGTTATISFPTAPPPQLVPPTGP